MRISRLALVVLAAGLVASPVLAGMPMNLGELSQSADKIFRGKVVGIRSDVAITDGAAVPTTTYIVQVEEAIKGSFATIKDVQLAEIRTAGSVKVSPAQLDIPAEMSRMPQLGLGETYLLFTTAPDQHGLTTTVGQDEGRFEIDVVDPQQPAFNGIKNHQLFTGMAGIDSPAGAVPYSQLVERIRFELGQE